tara:strand:- start:655 stop:768 length:114 start_codon:yes stop_codon:yes gene_type:complete
MEVIPLLFKEIKISVTVLKEGVENVEKKEVKVCKYLV